MTPTQRSLALLRDTGWHAEVVEKWNPHARIRQDLFGFIDILAIRPGEILGVQTTSWTNVPARVRKIGESPLIGVVREAGIAVHVHGWRKNPKARGWELRTVDLS